MLKFEHFDGIDNSKTVLTVLLFNEVKKKLGPDHDDDTLSDVLSDPDLLELYISTYRENRSTLVETDENDSNTPCGLSEVAAIDKLQSEVTRRRYALDTLYADQHKLFTPSQILSFEEDRCIELVSRFTEEEIKEIGVDFLVGLSLEKLEVITSDNIDADLITTIGCKNLLAITAEALNDILTENFLDIPDIVAKIEKIGWLNIVRLYTCTDSNGWPLLPSFLRNDLSDISRFPKALFEKLQPIGLANMELLADFPENAVDMIDWSNEFNFKRSVLHVLETTNSSSEDLTDVERTILDYAFKKLSPKKLKEFKVGEIKKMSSELVDLIEIHLSPEVIKAIGGDNLSKIRNLDHIEILSKISLEKINAIGGEKLVNMSKGKLHEIIRIDSRIITLIGGERFAKLDEEKISILDPLISSINPDFVDLINVLGVYKALAMGNDKFEAIGCYNKHSELGRYTPEKLKVLNDSGLLSRLTADRIRAISNLSIEVIQLISVSKLMSFPVPIILCLQMFTTEEIGEIINKGLLDLEIKELLNKKGIQIQQGPKDTDEKFVNNALAEFRKKELETAISSLSDEFKEAFGADNIEKVSNKESLMVASKLNREFVQAIGGKYLLEVGIDTLKLLVSIQEETPDDLELIKRIKGKNLARLNFNSIKILLVDGKKFALKITSDIFEKLQSDNITLEVLELLEYVILNRARLFWLSNVEWVAPEPIFLASLREEIKEATRPRRGL